MESSNDRVQCFNCLTYVDTVFGIRGLYDKRHLAPFSEFTPATGEWLQIASRKNFQHGEQTLPVKLCPSKGDRKFELGYGLCYDVAFAEHFRKQTKNGNLDFFVVSGSEGSDKSGCMAQLLLK